MRRFRAASVLASAGAALLAGEITARLVLDGSATADDIARSLEYLRPCARVEERDGRRVLVIENWDKSAAIFPAEKPRGVFRVIVVGESTGLLMANALREAVARAGEDKRVEVLPCALAGAALEHVERRATEVLDYSPDAIVVVFGHNFMMRYTADERLLARRALLTRSRLIMALLGGENHAWDASQRTRRIHAVDAWLRAFARRARERNVAPTAMTLTANLSFPPAASPAALSDPRFLAVELDEARGQGARAERALAALVAEQPEPYWHFVLGTWLARRGETRAAAGHLEVAVDTAAIEPDRRAAAVNAAIRQAAHDEQFGLFDSDDNVRRQSAAGLPGWDVMRDHCHLLPRYVRSEATRLLGELLPDAPPLSPPADEPVWLDEMAWILNGLTQTAVVRSEEVAPRYHAAIASFVEYAARTRPADIRAAVAAYTAGAIFSSAPLPRRAGLLCAIAQGYWNAGQRDEAHALNATARGEDAAEPWVQLGLFRVAEGSTTAAAEAFRSALKKDPDRTDAQFFLSALAHRAP